MGLVRSSKCAKESGKTVLSSGSKGHSNVRPRKIKKSNKKKIKRNKMAQKSSKVNKAHQRTSKKKRLRQKTSTTNCSITPVAVTKNSSY